MVTDPSATLDYSWAPPLVEHGITDGRRVRVVGIGAGFSGIDLLIHTQEHLRNADVQLYDRADGVGGVWHHNRYAGVACDIPAHTYQYSFCENTQWSRFYAPGGEIRQYLVNVVEHYGLMPQIKLQHEVTEARWLEHEAKWRLQITDLVTGEQFEDKADFLCYATGLLSSPVWPKIPGREKYKGIIHHSAKWDAAKEAADGVSYAGKQVGVIGMGSSAIQILPEMQAVADKVYNFGRASTWLAGVFAADALEKLGANTPKGQNHIFTDEEKAKLKDPEYYRGFRDMIERDLGSVHGVTHQNHPLQITVREQLHKHMENALKPRPEIAAKIIPNFPPGCKRLTPGPGYLEALVQDNVEFVSDEIAEFTEKGIKTAVGNEYELDAIICATGFDTSNVPGFPIIGRDGINLQDVFRDDPKTYLAVTAANMPNFFLLLNTQSAVGSGSLLMLMEQQVAYACKAINKCQSEGYKSMVIKTAAVDSFMRYTDKYFGRTVFTANCKSWYKNGAYGDARIRTLWPGSSQHAFVALRNPRWEDYDFEREQGYDDEMAWLGNGHIPDWLDPGFYVDELRAYHKVCPMLA